MPEEVLKELAFLNAIHDVFIVLIDSALRLRAAEGVGRLD